MMHTHKGKTNKYPILAPPIRCLHGFPRGLALQKHSGGINPTDRHTLCYFRIGYFIFFNYCSYSFILPYPVRYANIWAVFFDLILQNNYYILLLMDRELM